MKLFADFKKSYKFDKLMTSATNLKHKTSEFDLIINLNLKFSGFTTVYLLFKRAQLQLKYLQLLIIDLGLPNR